jgi:hypothetical protein
MDSRLYPNGKGGLISKWVAGVLKFYKASDRTEFYAIDPVNKRILIPDTVRQIRTRFTIAQVNAGATLLAALPGYKYRMVDASIIAVGGAAAAHTSIDIIGTLSSARKLVAFLVAGTTENTLLRDGAATNGVILAAGASYTANDANTAVTVGKTGSDVTTATHVDISFTYVIEVA